MRRYTYRQGHSRPPLRSSRGWKWVVGSTCLSAAIVLGVIAAGLNKEQSSHASPAHQSVVERQDDQLALSRRLLSDKWGAVHATKSDNEHRDEDLAEASFADAVELADPAAVRPALMRDRRTRKIMIGNFLTRSFDGDQAMCVDLGQKMSEDVGAPEQSMEVLVDTDFMTMLRLCAVNGSIVMTCRNGQVTISPRRSRPDDGCSGVSLAVR